MYEFDQQIKCPSQTLIWFSIWLQIDSGTELRESVKRPLDYNADVAYLHRDTGCHLMLLGEAQASPARFEPGWCAWLHAVVVASAVGGCRRNKVLEGNRAVSIDISRVAFILKRLFPECFLAKLR